MNIANNIRKIKSEIPDNVTIIGVTKYIDTQIAKELLNQGITNLGENRADVFLEKYNEIGNQAIWHFIGNLQTRKVRDIINKIDYLHSLDRISLATEINKRADKKIQCFIQVNISQEENKNGLKACEVTDFVKHLYIYDKIEVVGLMTMAPNTKDETVIRSCFANLRRLQKEVEIICPSCTQLSMGMTNDYKIAIEEGATFVRLGRCLVN